MKVAIPTKHTHLQAAQSNRTDQSLQKSVLFATGKEIFKNAPRSTKKKRTKCYKETLGKAATKTQQKLKITLRVANAYF